MKLRVPGAWAKIERAREQLDQLNREANALFEGEDYRIVDEYQPERQRYVFKLQGPPIPDRFSILSGEIIHHLRCCFDHIAWALALSHDIPEKRLKGVYFPVCDSVDKFQQALKRGALYGVSDTYLGLVESIQPFNTSDAANSILKTIHDLDIIDKHRLLVVVSHALVMGDTLTITRNDAPVPLGFGIELPPIEGYPWAIEDGLEVHWVPVRGGPSPGFEMKTNASILLSLEKIGNIRRPFLIETIFNFIKYTNNVVQMFSEE